MKILIATNNQGKLKEAQAILSDLNIDLVTIDQVFDQPFDVEETGDTFEENACLKAEQVGDKSGLITIADDSGLEVDALNGEPGVYSARYEATDTKRINKILSKLENIPQKRKTARFISVVCIYHPVTKAKKTTRGEVEGMITKSAQGENGFGYDPIFYSKELKKTFAQASEKEKNSISHRRKSLEKAKPIIQSFLTN